MIKFLHNLIEPELLQKEILSFFCSSNRMNYNSRSNMEHVFKNNFKYNPDRFEDYGVDIKYQEEDKPNYFILTLSVIANNYYDFEESNNDKIEKIIEFFVDKGFSLDKEDSLGNVPRQFIETIISEIYRNNHYFANRLEKFVKEIEHKSLNNELDKSVITQPKKLKL